MEIQKNSYACANRDPISNGKEIKDKYEEISNQEFISEKNKQKYAMEKFTTSIHEGKKVFKCHMCGKTFCKKQKVNEHIASVHEGIKPFKCKICDKSFSQKSSLKTHVASVHEGIKAFKCDV